MNAVVPHEKGLTKKDAFDGVNLFRFRYFWPYSLEQVAYGFGVPDNLRRKFWAKVGLPFFLIAFFLKSLKTSKNCDLIHTHWEISAFFGLILAKIRRVPVVLTVHRIVARTPTSRFLTRWLLSRLDMLHFNSSFTRDQVLALLGKTPKHAIIYPSIDPHSFQPGEPQKSFRSQWNISKEVPIILGLGRLVEKKGFTYLIEAFSVMQKEKTTSAHLVIAGGGPLLDSLKKQAEESCQPNTFHFTDFCGYTGTYD